MQNFEFKNPVKIIFGKNQTSKITNEIPSGAKILMTYGGGSIKKNGVYDQVKEALKGFEVIEFGGIEANPEYTTLMKAVQIARENKIDFLLAVGGGSVIDGTKFIAGAIPFQGEDPWDILVKGLGKDLTEAIPFGTVLTIPATGSEANSGSVISRSELQEKRAFGGPLFFPQFSVLDPQVVRTLPPRQIANGTADAFWHVLEQYLTYPSGAIIQDRIAEGILNTLVEVGPKVIANPADYEAAGNLMYAAMMALNGQIQQGVPSDWATHMIGHELTAIYGIDHARTLSIIGPNLQRVMFENKKEKLVQFGARVWGITEGNEEEKAFKTIDKTVEFLQSLGIQTKLSEYTSEYEGVAQRISERFKERKWFGLGERQDITPEKVQEIVEMSI